jgi:hypothetical protein
MLWRILKATVTVGAVVGALAHFIGIDRAAAFTSTAFAVVGIGTGVTVASAPEFADGFSVGSKQVQSNYSKSLRSKLRGNCSAFGSCADELPRGGERQERLQRQGEDSR